VLREAGTRRVAKKRPTAPRVICGYATNYAIAFGITTTIILICKVSFMSGESGNSGAKPIKDCGESSDNFSDETRLEKINYLRKSLDKNTYHVSDADLASKIIEHMLQVD
jgi:hypothetical protein